VIQTPEIFKANPEPQIPEVQAEPAAQAVAVAAPTEAIVYPAAAAEHAVADV